VGFSSADPESFVRPAQTTGKYGARQVNVESQMTDADSLLRWFQQLLATLRMCPEIGVGSCTVVDVPLPPSVLAYRFDAPEGAILLLHNLGEKAAVVDLKGAVEVEGKPVEVFANTAYPAVTKRMSDIELTGYGYRWLRLRDR
jgi:maltose alpha-D-glucosyltransferase/alpha-amylase